MKTQNDNCLNFVNMILFFVAGPEAAFKHIPKSFRDLLYIGMSSVGYVNFKK